MAVVGTLFFATLTDELREVSKGAVVTLGLVSVLSAAITAGVTFLDFNTRAKRQRFSDW